MSVPNLKRVALFVQKLLGGPKCRPATDPLQTNPQTHQQAGPITTHCATKLSAQCKEMHRRNMTDCHGVIFNL